jgi:hypothetical protein
MLYIFGATAVALIVFASRKGNRNLHVRELEVRAAKLKAAARRVDRSAAAVDAALKPLMIA